MIQPLRALPFNTMKHQASIYTRTCWLQRIRDRKSTCTPFCRDRPAKELCPESSGPGGQDARRWNQGQENLIDERFLDCEIHFTTILEKCADVDVLYKPRTKH